MSELPNGGTLAARNKAKAKLKIEWTHSLSMKLCKLYKNEESLYNVHHEDYHNRDARCAAWARITSVLGVSTNASKKRVDSIRTQYVKYLRDSTGRLGKPWFVDKVRFLNPFIKGRAGDNLKKDEAPEKNFTEDSSDTTKDIKFECNSATDTVLEEYGDNDSVGGGDEDEEEQEDGEEESMDDTSIARTSKDPVQRASYPKEIKRSRKNLESSFGRSVGNSSRIISSTDSGWRNRAETVNGVARTLNSSSAPTEDVHDAFGRYIASELRVHRGSAKALATCKREIFMAISKMNDADNDD